MNIKRYANRKLYDTEAGRYVTLEEIGEAIRRGEDVTVRDHASGVDMTAITLMQVMFEREKRVGGLLPKAILTGLIQTGSAAVGSLRNGLSAIRDNSTAVETEIGRRLKVLLDEGKIAAEEFQHLTELLLADRFRPAGTASAEAEDVRAQEEAEKLLAQIEDLERQIGELRAR